VWLSPTGLDGVLDACVDFIGILKLLRL